MNKKEVHILHIPSWFPSKVDQFSGDFVERHINTLKGTQTKNHIIYVVAGKSKGVEISENENITKEIIYYKSRPLVSHLTFFLLLTSSIINYTRKHQVDLIHAHVSIFSGIVVSLITIFNRIPFVVIEHFTIYHDEHKARFRKALIVLARLINRAKYILPVSHNLKMVMKKNRIKGVFRVVPNVVDDYFFRVERKSMEKSTFNFLHVSSFANEQKNVAGLLNAFEKFIRRYDGVAHLTLVGSDNHEGVQRLIKDRDLEGSCAVLGPVSNKEIANLMAKHHAFVLFSNFENLPCVLLEAQAVGLPIISSDVGGINEIITSNEHGILCKPADEEELAQCFSRIIERYGEFSHDKIREVARSKYGKEVIQEQLLSIYQRAINE